MFPPYPFFVFPNKRSFGRVHGGTISIYICIYLEFIYALCGGGVLGRWWRCGANVFGSSVAAMMLRAAFRLWRREVRAVQIWRRKRRQYRAHALFWAVCFRRWVCRARLARFSTYGEFKPWWRRACNKVATPLLKIGYIKSKKWWWW